MKVYRVSRAMSWKKNMVLMLVGLQYLVQFHIVKVQCHATHNGDYAVDREGLGVTYKHSVKTVQNARGDIFDCVDIYEQPALDHPSLKDHRIQMAPSSFPGGQTEEGASKIFPHDIFLNEDCPIGTIPITRSRKNGSCLTNTSSSKTMDVTQDKVLKPLGSYEAQVRMKSGSYYGAEATLNVYGLPQVSANHLSSSIICILNDGDGRGDVEKDNSIMAGWMIDGFRNTGCYDHLCPGFVQVNPGIPLGATLGPLSVYDGTQYAIRLLVFKDPTTGDWWLAFGKNKEAVGYWPKSLFNTLNDHATKVYWGGLVKSPINEPSAPMGSGHFAAEGLRRACYSADLYLVDGSNDYMRIPEDEVEFRHSDPGCYRTTGYLMNMNFGSQGFLFGGPGNCALMMI
ncbi:uncharacterized protein LOC109832646 isoform X2 [Asparagus officinalis]|uniref:uncharacterized protein LOC109832646 isoform X2 n=1 Tax=Asparagus officinalis TaxID=4686 RepID=UPI00098E4EE4|nr:uncharacterized protein LOC109832646 isoform X2 [Asparagus officinalis]